MFQESHTRKCDCRHKTSTLVANNITTVHTFVFPQQSTYLFVLLYGNYKNHYQHPPCATKHVFENSLFLIPLDPSQHILQFINTLLQRRRLITNLTRFRRRLSSWLTLHHNIEINQLICQRRHVILKAECIFSDGVACENVIALFFPLALEEEFTVGCGYFIIYIEGASRLDLREFGGRLGFWRVSWLSIELVHTAK